MVRSGSDRCHIGIDGRVIVLVAAVVLPFQLTILGPFEGFDIAIRIGHRMIDIQSDPFTQQRWSQTELEFPT